MTIAAQQTYGAYKASGIDWVGEIPATWKPVANKHLFRIRKTQVGKRSSQYDLLSLTLRGIIRRDMENPEGKFPAEFDTYQEVRPGDFVFCHFDVEETPRTVGLSTHHGMITGAYTVYEPTGDADSGFLYYFYLHADTDKKLRSLYKGLRNTIPKDTFAAFKTPLPPLPDQRAIAVFLDRKCATIDEAVRIKEEQIRLLAERRQILIQEAVTRGLNPDGPMKDSGIDWIGQIPAHWEVKRFKSVATACGRIGFRGYSTTDLVNKGEGAVTLSPSNLSDGLMQFEKCSYISWKKYQESPEIQVEEGDVLVVKTGSTFGKTGFVRKLPEPATINPQLVVLKKIKCDSEFLYHLISSPQFQAEVKRRVIGSTIPTISESRLLGIDLQIPPRDEQNEIIDHIAAVSDQINAVIALKESQITALREYKTSLINAAVTGKIKVF